jgi:hypothetical protein
VTGDFTEEGLTDDINDFDEAKMLSLSDWLNFYDKEYKMVGVVEGRFYDSNGKLTSYGEEVSFPFLSNTFRCNLDERQIRNCPGIQEKTGPRK